MFFVTITIVIKHRENLWLGRLLKLCTKNIAHFFLDVLLLFLKTSLFRRRFKSCAPKGKRSPLVTSYNILEHAGVLAKKSICIFIGKTQIYVVVIPTKAPYCEWLKRLEWISIVHNRTTSPTLITVIIVPYKMVSSVDATYVGTR